MEHVRLSENENIGPGNYTLILKGSGDGVLYSGLLSLQTFSFGNILREHNVQKLSLSSGESVVRLLLSCVY
jgi:hypothetical protein